MNDIFSGGRRKGQHAKSAKAGNAAVSRGWAVLCRHVFGVDDVVGWSLHAATMPTCL